MKPQNAGDSHVSVALESSVPLHVVRAQLTDLVGRAVHGEERIVITRHGKPLAALVSYADLQWLERLEDAHDAAAALAVSDDEREPFDPAALLDGGEGA